LYSILFLLGITVGRKLSRSKTMQNILDLNEKGKGCSIKVLIGISPTKLSFLYGISYEANQPNRKTTPNKYTIIHIFKPPQTQSGA
jgi:hypothetical protein